VSNQPDGTVYAEFEGSPGAVDAMVAWCRTGPSRAHVTDVEVTPLEPTGETGFSVH
jgi:acylphosphatase